MKKIITDYSLALPGYLISLYLISPLGSISRLLWVVYLSVGFWLAYPWLLKVRPKTGIIRGMASYEPPYVKQMTDPDKQAPREPVTAAASFSAILREVGGMGLLQVCLLRWGLFVIALPWLLVIGLWRVFNRSSGKV